MFRIYRNKHDDRTAVLLSSKVSGGISGRPRGFWGTDVRIQPGNHATPNWLVVSDKSSYTRQFEYSRPCRKPRPPTFMGKSSDKSGGDSPTSGVPKAVVSRLSLYLRELQHLVRDGQETTNSSELGRVLGFTNAQVRKDLACFGQFGYPGVGYRCAELIAAIKDILGTNRVWPVAMVGVGNLGRALLGYRGFQEQGFQIEAAFDVDDDVVGTRIDGVEVFAFDELEKIIAEKSIRLAIMAVPSAAAQDVADVLVKAGVAGIMNFAPVTIALPSHVSNVGVDLAIELEQLSYAVAKKPTEG